LSQTSSVSKEPSANELCERCHQNKSSIGVVIQGVYYKLCMACKPLPKVSSGHARWSRSIDLEDHEADVQQPYGADGKPNATFVKLYPKQASAVFSDEQIKDILRS
jgi:hypothetical protein